MISRVIAFFVSIMIAMAILNSTTFAKITMERSVGLTEHPVTANPSERTSFNWRHNVGEWGEDFVQETLRIRGYNKSNIFVIKNGNQGVDLIALKRGPNGAIIDARIIEVKTRNGLGQPQLNHTKQSGQQLSRDWTAKRLREMRKSTDPNVRKLARELYTFVKEKHGGNWERISELHDVNTRTGWYTVYDSNKKVKSQTKVTHILEKISNGKNVSQRTKEWAKKALESYDRIASTKMSDWLSEGSISKNTNNKRLNGNTKHKSTAIQNAINLKEKLTKDARQKITRYLPRVFIVVTIIIEGKSLIDTELAYRKGEVSLRNRNIRYVVFAIGTGGAFLGAKSGAYVGAQLGVYFGPYGPIIGGIIGGVGGGIVGHFTTTSLASYTMDSWYQRIDEQVMKRFELEFIKLEYPIK